MDNLSLKKVAKQCGPTSHTFGGIWSSDNFPRINKQSELKRRRKSKMISSQLIKFQIINSSPSNTKGQHWLLLLAIRLDEQIKIFVWDCLGRPISSYDHLYSRLINLYGRAQGAFLVINLPLQNIRSNLCGLYCLYLVHYLVKHPFEVLSLHKNYKLLQTTEIDIVRFFNSKIIGANFKYNVY